MSNNKEITQTVDLVDLKGSGVEKNQLKGLYQRNNEKVIIYEPKRKYEPMISIERLFTSHLKTKSTADKSDTKAAEKPDAGLTDKSQNTKSSDQKADETDTENGIRIDHIKGGQPEWMSQQFDRKVVKSGLECVNKLRKFYIFDNIRMVDKLFDNLSFTRNCLTVRNADYQQLFFVGTNYNRNISSMFSFSLRFVDQYSRHIITIKKRFKLYCCCVYRADIECPPGNTIGRLTQTYFWFSRTLEFVITDPSNQKKLFVIKRSAEEMVGPEFDILDASANVMGSITKRFGQIYLNGVYKEDHCIRVAIQQSAPVSADDKALILSAAIFVNIFYLKYFTRK